MSSIGLLDTTITPDEWESIRRSQRVTSTTILDDCIAAGMPIRYASVEPDDYRASVIASSGRGLYIYGGVGAGKTHAACRILMGWLAGQYGTARMVSSPAMLSAIRATYDEGGSEHHVLDSLAGVGLLIVDDLGKESPTVWALSKLFEIFDARWGAKLPIVITAQCEVSRLAQHLAARGDIDTARAIASRIMGTCEVVSVKGQDRRVKRGKGASALGSRLA